MARLAQSPGFVGATLPLFVVDATKRIRMVGMNVRTTNLLLISFLLVVAGCAAPQPDGPIIPPRPIVHRSKLNVRPFVDELQGPDSYRFCTIVRPNRHDENTIENYSHCTVFDLDGDCDVDLADYARAAKDF